MKNKKLLILILMSIMTTSAIFAQDTTAKTYKIGDDGPGGGIIFYHSEVGFDVYEPDGSFKKCHYLEVSKVDLGRIKWCPCKSNKTCYIPTLKILGGGKINTLKIIKSVHLNKKTTLTTENCAALACHSYSTATTKAGEWFLPSEYEMWELLRNLKIRILASNTTDHYRYWTSCLAEEEGGRSSLFHNFVSDSMSYCYKSNTCSVRAVRAF